MYCVAVRACAADEAVRKSAAATAAKSNKAGGTAPADLDPSGSHYLTLDPLKEASSFIQLLHSHAPNNSQTWLYSMRLAGKKGRWLMAWRAIRKANLLQPADPDAHYELMGMVHHMQRDWPNVSDIVRQLIEEEWAEDGREGSLQQADVSAINGRFLQQHIDSIPHRHAGQTHTTLQQTWRAEQCCWLLLPLAVTKQCS